MATVAIQNFGKAMVEYLADKQSIMNTKYGLFEYDVHNEIKEGGTVVPWIMNESFFQTWENVTDESSATVNSLTQYKMQAVVQRTVSTISNTKVIEQKNGENVVPPNIAVQLMAGFDTKLQNSLASMLKGGFAATSSSDYKVDLTALETTQAILTIEKAREIVDTKYPSLAEEAELNLIVHPAVYNYLMAAVDTGYAVQDRLTVDGYVLKLGGFNIIKNGTVGAKTVGTGEDPDTYVSYITKTKPFSLSYQMGMTVEEEYKMLDGFGKTITAAKSSFLMTVNGCSWKGLAIDSPTTTAIETGDNWEWLFVNKETTPIIQLNSQLVANVV